MNKVEALVAPSTKVPPIAPAPVVPVVAVPSITSDEDALFATPTNEWREASAAVAVSEVPALSWAVLFELTYPSRLVEFPPTIAEFAGEVVVVRSLTAASVTG